jgi:hypothetical protein
MKGFRGQGSKGKRNSKFYVTGHWMLGVIILNVKV